MAVMAFTLAAAWPIAGIIFIFFAPCYLYFTSDSYRKKSYVKELKKKHRRAWKALERELETGGPYVDNIRHHIRWLEDFIQLYDKSWTSPVPESLFID